MPCIIHLLSSCIVPADSSIQSSSIKSIIRRHFFKKRTSVIQDHQRRNGSDKVRKVKCNRKSHSTSNNYDMTILHDNELENTHLAAVRRRKKKIPSWANKEQLQLAIINQVYFQDKNPEDIFGTVCIENVFDMINSIDIKNKESISMIVSRQFV